MNEANAPKAAGGAGEGGAAAGGGRRGGGDALTESERRVVGSVDVAGLVEAVRELVRIPSVTGSEMESAPQQVMAGWMADVGMAVDEWELDFASLSKHPSYCVEYDRKRGVNVAGMMGEDTGGKHLILNGHVDVVPEGDVEAWTDPPFEGVVRDGCIFGRGSLDMKGALCAGLFGVKALRDAGVRLKGKLTLLSVIGEEDGGIGTLASMVRGYRGDGAIVMEPTELAVVPAQAGALNFRIRVPGQAAHGAVRERGVSAIEKFFPIYQALMDFEARRNREAAADPLFERYAQPYPICIGTVRGGDWAASVAGEVTCEGRFGVSVDEDLTAARRAFEQTVAAAADADGWLREHRPEVQWWGAQFKPARTPTDDAIVRTVADAYEHVTDDPARVEGVPYGADMRLLVNDGGTPTVLYGPGDVGGAHRPDEHIAIEELRLLAASVALTAMRFCGVAEWEMTR